MSARLYLSHCDCCGNAMLQSAACKIVCPNCNYRLDCSDLTLYFDETSLGETPTLLEIPHPPEN